MSGPIMRRLPLLLPLGERESAADFLSRISTRNCCVGMDRLASDIGITASAVIAGKRDAIERLAEASGVDPAALRLNAFECRSSGNETHHRGHRFVRRVHFSRDWIRMCPECMKADLECHAFRREARPHRRAHWVLNSVRTCETHCTSLVSIGRGATDVMRSQDTSKVIALAIPLLDELLRSSRRRVPSGLEKYILERLDGVAGGGWIDTLPLHVVIQTSALLGVSAKRGVDAVLNGLSDAARWHVEAYGFEVLAQGEAGVRRCLDAMIPKAKRGESATGAKAVYGHLYHWLANANKDAEFDPIRQIVARHAVDHLPLGLGDRLFGKAITERRIHSVTSASSAYGMDHQRLYTMLIKGGWVPADAEKAPNLVTFDAIAAKPFLSDAKSAMTLTKALQYANVPETHSHILFKSDLVEIWMKADRRELKDHAFLPRHLDAFLARLLRRADKRFSDDPSFMTIASAQKRTFCGAEAIVRLIMDGKLDRVGRRVGERGYLSVLVAPADIKAVVDCRLMTGHSPKDVAAILRTGLDVVYRLLKLAHLEFVVEQSPRMNKGIWRVTEQSLKRFDAEYVSCGSISQTTGIRARYVHDKLAKIGVLRPLSEDVPFYRRSDVASIKIAKPFHDPA